MYLSVTGAMKHAAQLSKRFNSLSARVFDVFLDTHAIAPGEDFQAVLWHRLCDSDVLIMLDTAGYFEKRWTKAEYGRALAKGISVLRVGWPVINRSRYAGTSSRMDWPTVRLTLRPGNYRTPRWKRFVPIWKSLEDRAMPFAD